MELETTLGSCMKSCIVQRTVKISITTGSKKGAYREAAASLSHVVTLLFVLLYRLTEAFWSHKLTCNQYCLS